MLKTNLNAKTGRKGANLPGLLQLLGYCPDHEIHSDLYYYSMLRDNDTKPLFVVNKELNIWYDRGSGKGGNIIDFAMAYWNVTFRQALKKLGESLSCNELAEPGPLRTRRRHAQKVPNYRVEKIVPLGNNPMITNYLVERGIWQPAQTVLSEVYYFVEDEKGLRKSFFAAGWRNELGSWEVCSQYFKGCLGYKAITFIGRDDTSVCLFEGCFDYLSWLEYNPKATDSVIILNTAHMLGSAIGKAKDFPQVCTFFANDDAGRLKTEGVIQALPQALDRSAIYEGYNRNNEMVVIGAQPALTPHKSELLK